MTTTIDPALVVYVHERLTLADGTRPLMMACGLCSGTGRWPTKRRECPMIGCVSGFAALPVNGLAVLEALRGMGVRPAVEGDEDDELLWICNLYLLSGQVSYTLGKDWFARKGPALEPAVYAAAGDLLRAHPELGWQGKT